MNRNGQQADDRKWVQVLDRALTIVEFIASRPHPCALHEVASGTGIHPSTVHRLLWKLESRGYLERNSEAGWLLGLSFLELGSIVRNRLTIRDKAMPLMQVLYEKTGQTVNLSIRHGDFAMYVGHVYAPLMGVRLASQVGALAPLHCTSGGKLFLAHCSPEEVSDYIARTGLKPRTENSISTPERLILELNRIKDLGWADEKEELERGIQCIGAPVYDAGGTMTAAITIVSTTSISNKPEWVRQLMLAAAAVSASLGWLGGQS